ncbi:MAG: GPR endopeptidase, partial [Clostridia bacterium]|nr:GPR endopeptidase [Clostridia bacterium]
MGIRTDLVVEEKEISNEDSGVTVNESRIDGITVSVTEIKSNAASQRLSKPCGKYITIEFESFERLIDYSELTEALTNALKTLLPENSENVMIVGLGNSDITPDALGPITANRVLATRHISKDLAENLGLSGLKGVSVIIPGVLGKTGIETAEIITAAAEKTNPSAIITIDALAARKPSRLCNTVQLTNTGISPGSGVHNSRKELSQKNMGIPVIAIGVPTVVDISTYKFDLSGDDTEGKEENMIVTPKDIDRLVGQAAEVISRS